jgi:hypothetical protein
MVTDRGRANPRILQILGDLEFDYVLKISENLIPRKEQENIENGQDYAYRKKHQWI